MNADLTSFVDDLYRQRIPIWVSNDIRGDYMRRIDREQVANEVAFAIYAFLARQPECNPQMIQNSYGWCRRISRCIAINAIKSVSRIKRSLSRSRNFHVGETETLVDCTNTGENSTVDYEDFCQFHFNAMSDEQRAIAKLRIDGWSVAEISEWLECSPKRIQGKLSRISEFLAKRLSKEQGARIRKCFAIVPKTGSSFRFQTPQIAVRPPWPLAVGEGA